MLQLPEPKYGQTIPYDKAVAEGKQIVFDLQDKQWRLGELAECIEPRYGDSTLEKFAEEIGVSYGTMRKARAVVRAWPQIVRRRTISFGVATSLVSHPDREKIALDNPHLTVAEARKLVREYFAEPTNDDEKDEDVAIEDDHLDSEWLDNFIQMSKYSDDLINNWASRNFPENEKGYILSLAEKAVREWTSIVDEIRRSM